MNQPLTSCPTARASDTPAAACRRPVATAAALLTALFLPFAAGPARGATWTVDQLGTGDFTTITAGVAAAAAGDTVRVIGEDLSGLPLYYIEELDLDEAIVLLSVNRAGAIDTPKAVVHSSLFTTDPSMSVNADCEIRNFAISNSDTVAVGLRLAWPQSGGGALIRANASFVDCDFVRCTAENGGGAAVLQGEPIFAGCRFEQCVADSTTGSGQGGAVDCSSAFGGAVSMTFTDCTFAANVGRLGGAIETMRDCTIQGCTFTGNVSGTGSGGAIFASSILSSPILDVSGSEFSGNSAQWGGAVYSDSPGPVAVVADFTNCRFLDNHAVNPIGGGGGVFTDGGISTFNGCSFTSNSGHFGGALDNFNFSSVTASACTLSTNTGLTSGGAASNVLATCAFTDCVFTGNTASTVGGAVNNFISSMTFTTCSFAGNSASAQGGAVYSDSANDYDSHFVDCTFDANTATAGGAYYGEGDQPYVVGGLFHANVAGQGGAIYLRDAAPAVARHGAGGVRAERRGPGGGLAGPGSPSRRDRPVRENRNGRGVGVVISGADFVDNEAATAAGGAIFVRNSSLLLSGCGFQGNTANAARGGAISARVGTDCELDRCTFSGNAADEAGAVDVVGSTARLLLCSFENNTAVTDNAALRATNSSSLAVLNTRFHANVVSGGSPGASPYGGAAIGLTGGSTSEIINCTITSNDFLNASSGSDGGGGIHMDGGSHAVTNTILWGNTDVALAGTEGEQLLATGGATPAVNHTIVENWSGGLGGTANSGSDPLLTGNGHLTTGSAAIDAGDDAAVTWSEDLDGLARMVGTVDLGVYEWGGLPSDAPIVATPTVFAVHGATPNPFRTETSIRYDLPSPASVKLEVLDVQGRRIRLLETDELPAGAHVTSWDGRDAGGRRVVAGVYFYRLEAGERRTAGKVVRLQ